MAKKKVKKETIKKKVSNTKKVARKKIPSKNKISLSPKFSLVWKNLVFFALLALLFFGLYSYATEELYQNLFVLLSIIFGFVGVAFLIVLLIFLFLKILKK